MKILTWNINSVRLRLPLLLRLIGETAPDIIALQETKTPDEHFPLAPLQGEGYDHIHIHGMKSYNGVALISKIPFSEQHIHNRVGRQDCRHISVTLPPTHRNMQIHTLYIPAGGDTPDPVLNDKYAHKLDFVDEIAGWFADRYTQDQALIALGDFNIAPLEHDVWSHKQLLQVVSHTPPETERLDKMRKSLEWIDVSRHFVPEDQKCYTWWSYRNKDWKTSDRGRRLDHIWVTPPLKHALQHHEILRHARDWDQPSDHVPVLVEIDV